MRIIGLDHVQVAAPVGSESDACRFYGDLLGLSELEKPEALRDRGGVWFACGSQQLHVGVIEDFSPARKAHPALRVHPEDLDLIAERLTAAGGTVQWDDAIPDTRRFYITDPWGKVRDGHRREGIGLALTRAGEDYLRGCGARRITALVAFEDEVAGAFWESAGYPQDHEIGRRVRNL